MNARHPLFTVVVGAAIVSLLVGCVEVPPPPATPSSATVAAFEPSPVGQSSTPGSPESTASPPTSYPAPSSTASSSVEPSSSAPPSSSSPSPPAQPTLATVLAGLTVAPEHRTGYKRTLFRLWIDADSDGCDTRQEVLIAEALTAPSVGAGCALTGGEWLSLYDGRLFTDPGKLDIDHMVPLAEAWDSGAYAWPAARRKAFANDLGVSWALIAVSAAANRSKGDKDPAEWFPPRVEYRCTYLAVWVAIKARWALTVDAAEKNAIAAATDCQDTPVPGP